MSEDLTINKKKFDEKFDKMDNEILAVNETKNFGEGIPETSSGNKFILKRKLKKRENREASQQEY